MSHSPIGTAADLPGHTQAPLAGTADLLGLSADQLRFALNAGTTLAQLAAHMGVSTAELIKRVHTDLDADAQSLTDGHLDSIAAGLDNGPLVAPVPGPRTRIDAYA